jgi:hypothetical protein
VFLRSGYDKASGGADSGLRFTKCRVVARLEPASGASGSGKPWEELRALGGHTDVRANESVWMDKDFEALG